MIRSMTGYGRSMMHLGEADITVEIRAVNNRFLDVSVKLPRALSYCEDKIKAELQRKIARGKVDVFVTYVRPLGEHIVVEPNLNAAKSYADAMHRIDELLGTSSKIDAVALSRFPEVFTVTREVPDEDQVWADLKTVLLDAADRFNEMREAEGVKMAEDVLSKLNNIEELVGKVEVKSAPRLEAYQEKLYNKMLKVLEASDIDEKRILEEAAIYADHTAVDEETVRLRSHIGQFRDIIAEGGSTPPVPRVQISRSLDTLWI